LLFCLVQKFHVELLMPLVFPWWIELLTWLYDFHVVLIIWMLLRINFTIFWIFLNFFVLKCVVI
jgi:hypothetical protein